jgi:hypothetical protein
MFKSARTILQRRTARPEVGDAKASPSIGQTRRGCEWPFVALAVAFALFWPSPACADDLEAQQLFRGAEQAFDAQDYARAAQLFEEANRHAPHPSVLFNAAVSWDHAGELARAANDYRAALEVEGLSAAQTEESERRLAALSERLGYVQIAKPLGGLVSVAHIEREPVPARFYLDPGDYEVVLESASGIRSTTSIEVAPGQTLKVALDEVEVPEAEPEAQPEPEPEALPAPPVSTTQETLGWVTLGVGAVAAGVAVYFGTEAMSAQDLYLDQRSSGASPDVQSPLRRDAVDAQVRTNATWVGAGVASGLGVVLLLSSPTFEF